MLSLLFRQQPQKGTKSCRMGRFSICWLVHLFVCPPSLGWPEPGQRMENLFIHYQGCCLACPHAEQSQALQLLTIWHLWAIGLYFMTFLAIPNLGFAVYCVQFCSAFKNKIHSTPFTKTCMIKSWLCYQSSSLTLLQVAKSLLKHIRTAVQTSYGKLHEQPQILSQHSYPRLEAHIFFSWGACFCPKPIRYLSFCDLLLPVNSEITTCRREGSIRMRGR